jgi:hypothetical protein
MRIPDEFLSRWIENDGGTYDVLPDGKFVVIQRVRPVVPESIVVVLNGLHIAESLSGFNPRR